MSNIKGKDKQLLYKGKGKFIKRIKSSPAYVIPIDWNEVERQEILSFMRNIKDNKTPV